MKIKKYLNSLSPLILSFIVAGIFIGLLVVAQFRSSVTANSFLIDEIEAQKNLLESFDEDRQQLKNQIAVLRQKIEENRKNLALTADQASLAKLDELKKQVGLTKLQGNGVKIIISEGARQRIDSDTHLIHAADLRDLVNLLRTAKVDGISINGQRMVVNSTINSLGSTIMVNKVKVVSPFEINVVGDPELIANRISDQLAYPDLYKRIKSKDINFEMEKLNMVTLPPYDGDYSLKYSNEAK